MEPSLISTLIGSSRYTAVADDALKDIDNVAWVTVLEPTVHQQWVERISWIRLVDRLAENALVEPGNCEFERFYRNWNTLLTEGHIDPASAHYETLTCIRDRWLNHSTRANWFAIQAWEQFLSATIRYHQPQLVVQSLTDYTTMLNALSGSCFQILPELPPAYLQAARSFGALDQFFNNLRDLQEDARQGICYLPADVLSQFQIDRNEILQLTAYQNPNYIPMMQFWLNDYLPLLQQKLQPLLKAQDLPPSWVVWRDWSLHRYHRIETVFRACDFNYTLFAQHYWQEVERELPLLLEQAHQQLNKYADVENLMCCTDTVCFFERSPEKNSKLLQLLHTDLSQFISSLITSFSGQPERLIERTAE